MFDVRTYDDLFQSRALLFFRLTAALAYSAMPFLAGPFDFAPHDPMMLTAVVILFAGIALVATFVPARRAARVDPLVALRYE